MSARLDGPGGLREIRTTSSPRCAVLPGFLTASSPFAPALPFSVRIFRRAACSQAPIASTFSLFASLPVKPQGMILTHLTAPKDTGKAGAFHRGTINSNAVTGVTRFNGLSASTCGIGCLLTVTSSDLTPAESGAFDIVPVSTAVPLTTRVSVVSIGKQGHGHTMEPASIRTDERHVVLDSDAFDLVPGGLKAILSLGRKEYDREHPLPSFPSFAVLAASAIPQPSLRPFARHRLHRSRRRSDADGKPGQNRSTRGVLCRAERPEQLT